MAMFDTDNISSEGVPPKVAKFKPRLTPEEREEMKKPEVMIVGAGIGGVTLALLLHKAKIPFTLFDRAKQVKPLGRWQHIMCLSAYFSVLKCLKPLTLFYFFVGPHSPQVQRFQWEPH